MLPRLKQWFDSVMGDGGAKAKVDNDDALSTFMADDKLFVSESTITEFSRTVAIYEPKEAPRP